MQSIRSVLWLGKGERFAADLVEQAPLLDVVGQNDLAELRRHRVRHGECLARRSRPAPPGGA